MTHTPASWEVYDKVNVREANSNEHIAACGVVRSNDISQSEANAKLIAAAPDLLKAAKKALLILMNVRNENNLVENEVPLFSTSIELMETIKRAEGERD